METPSVFSVISSRPLQEFVSEPVIVEQDEPVSNVIGKLVSKRLNEVFVRHDSEFGIVTVRSILRAGEVSGEKLSKLEVTAPVLVMTDPVSRAVKVMSDLRVRSVPVSNLKGELKGAVTSSTILREVAKIESSRVSVSEIMTPRPVTVDFSDSLDRARSLMVDNDIDHLPVSRDGRLAGMITSLDVAAVKGPTDTARGTLKPPESASKGSVEVGRRVEDDLIISKPTDDSVQVLRNILGKGTTASIVMFGEAIRGIVTLRDYARLLAVQPRPTALPVYVVGLPEDDIESSLARSRFERSIEALAHLSRGINEARATVKASSSERGRKHFEVHVLIKVPEQQFDFTEEGWSIADVFERIGVKIKRLKTKSRDSPSYRRHQSRGEAESGRYAE